MRRIALLLLISLLLPACERLHRLSEDEIAVLELLDAELASTEADIKSAVADDSRYAGGLIKSLIATRIEILKTNKALLQQRISAIESGAPITVSPSVVEPDTDAAQRLAAEIATQTVELETARQDAKQYSGGLVLAMKLSAIATGEQTLALLKQRYLSAKYGLAFAPPSAPNIIAESDTAAVRPGNVPPVDKAPPADGPFGLKQGLSRDEIEAMIGKSVSLVPGASNVYSLDVAPKPHNAFESYVVVLSEIPGLCSVRGIGKDIPSSRHGIQLRTNFNEMETMLSEVYGPSEITDRLLPGSIWNDPEDFMMGLAKGERYLFAQWPRKGKSLKNDLKSITLFVKGKSSDSAYFVLEYAFSNSAQCEAEAKNAEKGSL